MTGSSPADRGVGPDMETVPEVVTVPDVPVPEVETVPEAVTVKELLAEIAGVLGDLAEARWVLDRAAGPPGATVATLGDDPVPPAVLGAARRMTRCRAAGQPLQYVLGSWAFRALEVAVDSRVLVPRPETEQVAGFALAELRRVAAGRPVLAPVAVDLGTGSGVVALSLAAEGPQHAEVWATDVSSDALQVARVNLERLASRAPAAAGRVHVARGSWFAALPPRLAGHVHLVVSNPPYVSTAEWEDLDPVVRDHEPRLALVAGPSGTEALEHIVDEAPRWLAPGSALVLELAPHQADSVSAAARRRGFAHVEVRPDLAGRDRALVARWCR